jgi:hypothetical protein
MREYAPRLLSLKGIPLLFGTLLFGAGCHGLSGPSRAAKSGGSPVNEEKIVYTSAFSSIIDAAAAARGTTLAVDNAIHIDENITVSVPHGRIIVEPGGMITIKPGTTLTFASPFSAAPIQVFATTASNLSAGTVRFASVEHIYPQWWGAVADGKTDDTAAFQRMFDATYDVPTGSYRTYTFLEGRYLINGTVTLDPKPTPPVAFGIQVAPTLLGTGMGSVTTYLGIGTTFIKNTTGPMFVIAGAYDAATDKFTLDAKAHVNPKYFTTDRIRFMSTLSTSNILKIKPVGILGESRHARMRDSIFTHLWTGIDTRGYSDYSLYDGCIFDCFKAVILRSPDATAFVRCQFGETFVQSLQQPGNTCGPAITMSGGDVKLQSCSMNCYQNEWAISMFGTGFPVLSIDDLHAEGCLLLNANCTPFADGKISGSRISISNSRMGFGQAQGNDSAITLNHIDGTEIANSVFYALKGTKLPHSLFSVSNGNLLVRGSSFIEESSASPYLGQAVIPGHILGPGGNIVFQ